MIIDLLRNDLGRVAEPGSVRVLAAADVLDLPHIHHLVGRIGARLGRGRGWGDLVAACHPCGSITGAPKRMAMELLRQVEGAPRGAYCGGFGWLGPAALELAVAIRTVELAGAELSLHAGGGIVADSEPAAEWDEVLAKAAPLARALGAEI
jgi:para-aminobenzoate synthetase component 1